MGLFVKSGLLAFSILAQSNLYAVTCEVTCIKVGHHILDISNATASNDFYENCKWLNGHSSPGTDGKFTTTTQVYYPNPDSICYGQYRMYCSRAEAITLYGTGYGSDLKEARKNARESCVSGFYRSECSIGGWSRDIDTIPAQFQNYNCQ